MKPPQHGSAPTHRAGCEPGTLEDGRETDWEFKSPGESVLDLYAAGNSELFAE